MKTTYVCANPMRCRTYSTRMLSLPQSVPLLARSIRTVFLQRLCSIELRVVDILPSILQCLISLCASDVFNDPFHAITPFLMLPSLHPSFLAVMPPYAYCEKMIKVVPPENASKLVPRLFFCEPRKYLSCPLPLSSQSPYCLHLHLCLVEPWQRTRELIFSSVCFVSLSVLRRCPSHHHSPS